jgi:hypothetical protein
MQTHELKTEAVLWDAVARGEKRFEVRRNDRFFQAGDRVDLLRLHEKADGPYRIFTNAHGYPESDAKLARRLVFRIGPILQGGQFGIEPGYCIFSLLPLPGARAGGGDD